MSRAAQKAPARARGQDPPRTGRPGPGEGSEGPPSSRGAYSVHRPVVNEYLVRERDRRRLRDLAKVLLALAPVALALAAFTWVHLRVLDAGYRIDRLERELHALEREESRLRLEAAHLANPRRIERIAAGELGMRSPDVDRIAFPSELLTPGEGGGAAGRGVPDQAVPAPPGASAAPSAPAGTGPPAQAGGDPR